MDLRKSYFSKRNEFHKENQINRVKVLAKRELDTLDIIKRLSSLQNFFSWNNSAVLDLGAGDQFLRNAVEGRGANYTPVDYEDADFSKDKLPFKNNSFDLIISLAVIEHIENVSNYMEQAFRVLKPNGLFLLKHSEFQILLQNVL